MHYDKFFEQDTQPIPVSEKEEIRNLIYAHAGDSNSILGRTNDMTAWLFSALIALLEALEADEIENTKSVISTLLTDCKTKQNEQSTVDLKGAQSVITRFIESNHAIGEVLKDHYQLKETQNV
jgi:hypothetical protein